MIGPGSAPGHVTTPSSSSIPELHQGRSMNTRSAEGERSLTVVFEFGCVSCQS